MDAEKQAKKKYYKWSEEDMDNALTAFRKNQLGLNECCRQFNVPKATFKRRLSDSNKHIKGSTKRAGVITTLPAELEADLVEHVLRLEACFFGITRRDVMNLAYQLVEKNKIYHRFNNTLQRAGKKWYYNFIRRHPELSLRLPEKTSMARAKGFNRENVTDFFNIYERIFFHILNKIMFISCIFTKKVQFKNRWSNSRI